MSFDIKLRLRERLLNHEACRRIQHVFGKLDIKRSGQWYSINKFTSWFSLQTSDYDLIIDVRGDSMSLTMPLKKGILIMTLKKGILIKAHAVR